uniref:AA_permease_N domain-containing protein n=1 Tax=Rhodnius prolixus TaxID=13249 RepID=T1I3D9_RHOPR
MSKNEEKEGGGEGNQRDSWTEMNERRPRFQVNRVDAATRDAEELDRLCDDDDDEYIGSYGKSFRHFTREALPRMDNYRNIMSIQAALRPTLEELHNETLHGKVKVCDSFYLLRVVKLHLSIALVLSV